MEQNKEKFFQILEEKTGTKTFCVLPWIHLATRANGDMRLCCSANASGTDGSDTMIGFVKDDQGNPANFRNSPPMTAWNNEYMRNVRTTMLRGEIPASCTKCFKEESLGVTSKRVWETYTWMNDGVDLEELVRQTQIDGTVPEKLVYLDLRLNNTCNLKCVMCSPYDSSRWSQDHSKLIKKISIPIIKEQMPWSPTDHDYDWHELSSFWDQLYEQIPNLKQVYFAGGEPLMIKEHKMFLQEIIRQGYADKILIRYNSNVLLLDDETIDMWKQFSKVKFAVSLDAVGDRNYYIRYPSDWNTIVQNLHKLDNTPDNIQVSLATAIQAINIKHLPDFARWKIKENFKKLNLGTVPGNVQMGGGIFNMHLLYMPTFLSCKILPKEDKEEVTHIFAEFKQWLWDNYRQDDDYWKHNPYGWRRWQAILDFMNSDDHSDQLPAFVEYFTSLDSIRGTDFKITFPELAHLFK